MSSRRSPAFAVVSRAMENSKPVAKPALAAIAPPLVGSRPALFLGLLPCPLGGSERLCIDRDEPKSDALHATGHAYVRRQPLTSLGPRQVCLRLTLDCWSRWPKFCLLGQFFCSVWRADDRDAHPVLSLWASPSIPSLRRRGGLGYSLGSLER
jgi:hypothetical protein